MNHSPAFSIDGPNLSVILSVVQKELPRLLFHPKQANISVLQLVLYIAQISKGLAVT